MVENLGYILQGVFLLLLLPGSILLLLAFFSFCFSGTRRFSKYLLIVPLFEFGVFSHDLYANFKGIRPWMPIADRYMPDVFGLSDRDTGCIASIPFDKECIEFTISHIRRYEYFFGMWIPREVGDFVPTRKDIHMTCRFFDESGKEVYKCTDARKEGWAWRENLRMKGSHMCYGKYEVPDDLPYDEKLKVVVDFTGDVAGYRNDYPDAKFVILKWASMN